MKIDLDNPEFQKAYELLRHTNANVFLTGKAGTGKSTFLRYICKHLKKKYVVLAPTGIAAVNVGGVTIHSFFQMPLRPVPPDDPDYSVAALKKSKKISRRKRKLIQELELIIIDEVSMVRPDMIDFIDRTLRAVTGRRGKPFGGVQLLLVGDIFQLEPVVTSESKNILAKYYPDFFFFNAVAYNSAQLISIELKKIYRQTDSRFINLLDRIRVNNATYDDFILLNSRFDSYIPASAPESDKFGITLTSRRDSASYINNEKMSELPSEEFIFEGIVEDDFPDKILPTDLNLVLKKDAQVMLIRNDKEKRWVNGTLARIFEISDKEIKIELENGNIEIVEKEEWQNINYTYDEKEKKIKEKVIGRFIQYPLKAAWALTIHKSQGLTFNNVTIDMAGGAFSAGQTYVALSRCRSLEGIRFINPLHRGDIIVSRGAANFSKNFNDVSAAEKVLNETKAANLSAIAREQFDSEDFAAAVETMWKINGLNGALGKRGVRKLIARALFLITSLRKELKHKERLLSNLSKEYTELGELSVSIPEEAEAAYNNFAKAYEIDNSNQRARFGMGKALMKCGKGKDALKILDEFLKTKNKFCYEARILKGDIYADMGDYSNAALNYQAAIKSDRHIKEPFLKIIEVYEKAGLEELADQYRTWLDEDFAE